MTFLDETTRILFHQLPLGQQLAIMETEARLAKVAALHLSIEKVIRSEGINEVVVRISIIPTVRTETRLE